MHTAVAVTGSWGVEWWLLDIFSWGVIMGRSDWVDSCAYPTLCVFSLVLIGCSLTLHFA